MPKNNLRSIRTEKKLSQVKLSVRTGIACTTISAIETGRIVPFNGWKTKLAEALGMSVEEIFPETEV
jgi:putative transcriptional regulator